MLLQAVRKAPGGSPPRPSELSRPPVPARHTAISPGAWALEVPVTELGAVPGLVQGQGALSRCTQAPRAWLQVCAPLALGGRPGPPVDRWWTGSWWAF